MMTLSGFARFRCVALTAWTLGFGSMGAAENGPLRSLDAASHFLGHEGEREWQENDGKTPEGRTLEIRFAAQPNAQPATLLIRQRDVKLSRDLPGTDAARAGLHQHATDREARFVAQRGKAIDCGCDFHISFIEKIIDRVNELGRAAPLPCD